MPKDNRTFLEDVQLTKSLMSKSPRNCEYLMIPIEVLRNPELSPWEKIILSEIISLDVRTNRYGGCYASNEYLSYFCGDDLRKVQRYLKRLRDLGYIKTKSFDGKIRVMCVNPQKIYYGDNEFDNKRTFHSQGR